MQGGQRGLLYVVSSTSKTAAGILGFIFEALKGCILIAKRASLFPFSFSESSAGLDRLLALLCILPKHSPLPSQPPGEEGVTGESCIP